MADPALATERLILRDWTRDDIDPFLAHLNTPAVMRWLGGVQSRAKFLAAYDRLIGYRRDFGHTFWIVERRRDGGHLAGEMLGFCGLKRRNVVGAPVFGDVEIGWRLREDAWGRGYAREAATASLDAAFVRFGAPHVVALTVAGNAASRGLMTRLGMTRHAELDYHDPNYGPDLNPTIVYRIDRDEWRAQQEKAS